MKKETSAFLFGLAIISALPFWPLAHDPIVPIRTLMLGLWSFIFSIAAFRTLKKKDPFPKPDRLTQTFYWLFIAFIGYGFLSTAFSWLPSEGFLTLTKFGMMFTLFHIVRVNLHLQTNARASLFRGITLVAIVASILGILQFFKIVYGWPGPHPTQSFFYYRNLFASALFLCVPFICKNLFMEKLGWRIVSLLALLLTLTAMGMCRSGNAILATIIFFPLFLFLRNRVQIKEHPLWRRIISSPFVIYPLLIGGLIALFIWRFPGKTMEQWYRAVVSESQTILVTSNSMQERTILWNKSYEMAKDHPLLGVGPGHWKIMIPEYGLIAKRINYGDRYFVRPHNDWLWVLTEYGIPGTLIFISIFFLALFRGFRVFSKHDDPEVRLTVASSIYGILGYMLISTFSYPLDRIFHPVILVGFFALVFAPEANQHFIQNDPKSSKPQKKGLTRFMLFGMVLLSIVITASGLEQTWLSQHLRKIHKLRENKYWGTVRKEASIETGLLVKLDPYNAAPFVYYSAEAVFNRGNYYERAEAHYKEAVKINPYHVQVRFMEGRVLQVQAKHEEAIVVFRKLLADFPLFLEVRRELIMSLIRVHEYEEAKRLLDEGDFDYKYPRNRGLRDLVLGALESDRIRRENIERLHGDPEDPDQPKESKKPKQDVNPFGGWGMPTKKK